MTLATDLEAFYLEHRRCGELESTVDEARVSMACSCGAILNRPIEEPSERR